ncbi:hypothetical protein KZ810_02650 [Sphingomonas sp. RHCKR47]|uniref:hypothetical protein n=1 Tax=Sphingomonas citricola TaxID=2862498 RepID=UPI001CA5AE16|nr:hypothetical protein [Sphingomonas citricola]MBW6522387.1 hypothetical protein [Sphingomonas citricola]
MSALAVSVAAIAVGSPTAYVVRAYRKQQAKRLRRRERRNAAAIENGRSWAKLMRRD